VEDVEYMEPAQGLAPPDSLAAAADAITAIDPFRLEHRPSTVAYRPELEGTPPTPRPPAPPKPTLALAGLVGGPPWAALLDGVPGRDESVLVHAGEVLGGLQVRRVSAAGVTISGMDTTWHLTLKHPWP
jgi:hypothetical protein